MVCVSLDAESYVHPYGYVQPAGSLTRFSALRALTLRNAALRGELPALPHTLTSLVLDDATTRNEWHISRAFHMLPRLQTGGLARFSSA